MHPRTETRVRKFSSLKTVLNGWVQKMRGKEELRERGKEEKEREKGRKNWDLKLLFICAVVIFF